MNAIKTHSFNNFDSGLKYQKYINRLFNFYGYDQIATCKAHDTKMCQACTHNALKNVIKK